MVDTPVPVKKSASPNWWMKGKGAGTEIDPSEACVVDTISEGHLATIAGAILNGKMLCDTEVTATIDPGTLAISANQSISVTPATVTGTCTAAYVAALSLSCLRVPNKSIIVVNTHATLTMKYRIRGYAKSGSTYYNEIQAEATLAASTSQPHVIQNSYDVITVEVIDGSGHATYAIDYSGGQ